jgi:hypothetical protein
MENSFYYFFSAVPQVLGGVLALFGVFIVFKVQSLNSELYSIGSAVITKGNQLINVKEIAKGVMKHVTMAEIGSCVDKADLKGLSEQFTTITDIQFMVFKDVFNEKYSFLKMIIQRTIFASIYTAIVIFTALTMIPFGTFMTDHPIVLNIIFLIMGVSIGMSFYLFIRILRTSLNSMK